ncbi:MAG: hypothetical protein ACRDTX_19730 [Pseudonocardiaceae bacterium]
MEFATVPRRSPLRVVVVAAEVVIAIVLAGVTWWCWHRGVVVTVRRGVAMNRIEGRWWGIAIGAATVAGILLLDAGRRVSEYARADRAPALSR